MRAVTGTPRMHDNGPAWSPDGATIAYASERSGFYELHLAGATRTASSRSAGADHLELAWHPDGTRLLAVRGRRNRFDVVVVDAATGEAEVVAEGGAWGCPHWTPGGRDPRHLRGPRDAARAAPRRRRARRHAPAPRATRRAPYAALEEVVASPRSTAWRSRPSCAGRRTPRPSSRCPPIVYPHGGPTDAYLDDWDGHAQYFVDKGYAWLAPNFRGSTGYGRDYERLNHGVWGVKDTEDCLAAADYLRTLDWVDGERLGIFGASYGSYMALAAVTDDPEHRFRCAVAKYGDCDIAHLLGAGRPLRRAGPRADDGPAVRARARPTAPARPTTACRTSEAPLLIAHGERDERVSPKQSEQLVAELRRLGKTFEYVTYPTEGHGFLRAGPQLDFYRRLERFLDWHLM